MKSLADLLAMSGSISFDIVRMPVKIYYLDTILQTVKDIRDKTRVLRELEKFHKAAMSHDYRGHSSGHQNGVIDINPSNTCLMQDYARLLEQNMRYLRKIYAEPAALKPIKIVAHIPNGNRLVGTIDTSKEPYEVYVLGLSNYSGKVA